MPSQRRYEIPASTIGNRTVFPADYFLGNFTLAKSKKRKDRIAALEAAQEAERSREGATTERLGAPASLEIPLKPCPEGAEPQADLEDEYFGGFSKSDSDVAWRQERPGSPGGAPKDVPGCEWRRLDGWGWGLFALPSSTPVVPVRGAQSSWNRVWRNRIAAPKDLAPAPPLHLGLEKRNADWLGEAIYQDRVANIARMREANSQRYWCRRFKPSKVIEAKRFPKLEKIETKLIPKEGPGKDARRLAARALSAELMAAHLADGGAVNECPSEWTTRDLSQVIAKYETRSERGRPRKHADNAARQKQYREAKKQRDRIINPSPSLAPQLGDGNARSKRVGIDVTALDQGDINARRKRNETV
jgi:hypothetical protein